MDGTKTQNSESMKDNSESDSFRASKKTTGLNIEGYPFEGLSIGDHETCIIFPTLKLAFDIGRCPQRAISQDFLFISNAHMDHIITDAITEPQIAFTVDTMSDFIVDENNYDVLGARIIVTESTFIDDSVALEHAKDNGHAHLYEDSLGVVTRFSVNFISSVHIRWWKLIAFLCNGG